MRRARSFLHVCAGVFLLALAYHLGALSARAQSGAVIEGVNWTSNGLSAVVNGSSLVFDPNTGMSYAQYPLPVPGHVLETGGSDRLVYDNGDVWVYEGGGWVLKGNLASGPTPARQQTFGALKSRYRGAARTSTQDR